MLNDTMKKANGFYCHLPSAYNIIFGSFQRPFQTCLQLTSKQFSQDCKTQALKDYVSSLTTYLRLLNPAYSTVHQQQRVGFLYAFERSYRFTCRKLDQKFNFPPIGKWGNMCRLVGHRSGHNSSAPIATESRKRFPEPGRSIIRKELFDTHLPDAECHRQHANKIIWRPAQYLEKNIHRHITPALPSSMRYVSLQYPVDCPLGYDEKSYTEKSFFRGLLFDPAYRGIEFRAWHWRLINKTYTISHTIK